MCPKCKINTLEVLVKKKRGMVKDKEFIYNEKYLFCEECDCSFVDDEIIDFNKESFLNAYKLLIGNK